MVVTSNSTATSYSSLFRLGFVSVMFAWGPDIHLSDLDITALKIFELTLAYLRSVQVIKREFTVPRSYCSTEG